MNIVNLAKWIRKKPSKLGWDTLERMAVECECTPHQALAALHAGDEAALGRAFLALYVNGDKPNVPEKAPAPRVQRRAVKPHHNPKRRAFGRALEAKREQIGMTKAEFARTLGLRSGYHMAEYGHWIPTSEHPAAQKLKELGIDTNIYR